MTIRISLLVFDRCLASGVMGPIDLFYAANEIAAQMQGTAAAVFETQIISLDGRAVRAANGHLIQVDAKVGEAKPAQVIIVPGLSLVDADELIDAVEQLAPLSRWLRAEYAGGTLLAASCTGSFLLAEAGLLDGQPATTTTWFAKLFEQRYPKVQLQAEAVIANGERLVCGGGAMSYLDLTLQLIETCAGRELARACARYIVMDNRRASQSSPLIPHHAQTYDPLVTKAEKWMRANLRRHLRVQDIAEQVAVSMRTLIRRFKETTGDSPQATLQRLRLEEGKALLANSNYRMDQILERIGYRDDSAFRRLFKRYTNLSPSEYRRRFGRA